MKTTQYKRTRLPLTATAIALLAVPGVQAQSGIEISGGLDIGVYRNTAGIWNVGTIQRSHLQFAGTEELGNGLAATFKLRHRLDLDTGTTEGPEGKPSWHGESTVGLKGAFGSVRFGRALDAVASQDWRFDAWGNYDRIASPAWDLWHWNYAADPVGGFGRFNNGIFYDSPSLAGFVLRLSGTPERTGTDRTRGRAASVTYAQGPFTGMLGYAKNRLGASETFLGLRGTFAALTVMGVHNVSKSNGSKATSTTLGALYALGAVTLKAGWGQVDVDGDKLRRVASVGASYALSKRTSAYADLASKRSPTMGTKSTYGVGLTHNF